MKETFIKINNKKNSSQPQQLQNISCLVPKPLLEFYEIGMDALRKKYPHEFNSFTLKTEATFSKRFKKLCLWLYWQSITNEAEKEEKEYIKEYGKSLTSKISVPSSKMISMFTYQWLSENGRHCITYRQMLDILQDIGFLRSLKNIYSIERKKPNMPAAVSHLVSEYTLRYGFTDVEQAELASIFTKFLEIMYDAAKNQEDPKYSGKKKIDLYINDTDIKDSYSEFTKYKITIEETINILCDGETDFMSHKKDSYLVGRYPKYVNMGDWITAEDLELVDINFLELYNTIIPPQVDPKLQEKYKNVYDPEYYKENFVYNIPAFNDWLKSKLGHYIGLTVKYHTVKPKFYNHVNINYRLMKFMSLSKGYYNITESEKTGRLYTSLTLLPSDASQFITLKSGKKMVSLDGSNFSLAALSTLFKKYGINNNPAVEIFNIKTAAGEFYETLVAVLKKDWNNRYKMTAKDLKLTYCGNIQNVIKTIFNKTGIIQEVDDKFLRGFVKPLVFGNFLFNNNPPKNGMFARIINEAFGPGLYDALDELNIKIKEELKQQNILEDKTLAAVYQTLESNIFIKEILKDKRFDNGDIFAYTKHDSIIIDEDHVEIIEDILENIFKKYNVKAGVKKEYLNAKKEEPIDIIKEPVVEYINKNQNVMKKKLEDFETLIEYCYYFQEDGMLWILSKDMYNEYTNSDEYKEGEYFWYIDRYFHKDTNEVFLEFYNGIESLDEDGVYINDGVSIGPWDK